MAKPLASLNELLERRQKKAAELLTAANAKAQAAQAAPKPEPAQDHVPPKIGAKEVMAGFDNAMEIARTRRLAELARKHPEIAKLLKAQEAVKPIVVPPVETTETKKPVEAV